MDSQLARPAVSVIIPVYNAETFLPACSESLLGQSFRDWEAVCIDDGSTDASLDILTDYAARDARFRVLTQQNQGQGAARNRGMQEARGKYIAFVDADDKIFPEYLQLLKGALEKHPDAGLAWCPFAFEFRNEPEAVSTNNLTISCPRILEHAVLRHKPKLPLAIGGRFFRASVVRGIRFPTEFRYGEDIIFLCHALLAAGVGVYIPQHFYFYRQHEQSSVGRPVTTERLDDELLCTEQLAAFSREHPLPRRAQKAFQRLIAGRFFRYLLKLIHRSDPDGSKGRLAQYIPRLCELEAQRVFVPKHLSLRQYLKYRLLRHKFTPSAPI